MFIKCFSGNSGKSDRDLGESRCAKFYSLENGGVASLTLISLINEQTNQEKYFVIPEMGNIIIN